MADEPPSQSPSPSPSPSPSQGQSDPPDAASLPVRLKAARAAQQSRDRGAYRLVTDQRSMKWTVLAMRLMVDLITAVVMGGAIGFALDYWLGTRPILLAIMLLLGVAAGMLNMHRTLTSVRAYSKGGAPPSVEAAAGLDRERPGAGDEGT